MNSGMPVGDSGLSMAFQMVSCSPGGKLTQKYVVVCPLVMRSVNEWVEFLPQIQNPYCRAAECQLSASSGAWAAVLIQEAGEFSCRNEDVVGKMVHVSHSYILAKKLAVIPPLL